MCRRKSYNKEKKKMEEIRKTPSTRPNRLDLMTGLIKFGVLNLSFYSVRSIGPGEFSVCNSASLFPFPTGISNFSLICVLITRHGFGAINRVLLSILRYTSIISLIDLR